MRAFDWSTSGGAILPRKSATVDLSSSGALKQPFQYSEIRCRAAARARRRGPRTRRAAWGREAPSYPSATCSCGAPAPAAAMLAAVQRRSATRALRASCSALQKSLCAHRPRTLPTGPTSHMLRPMPSHRCGASSVDDERSASSSRLRVEESARTLVREDSFAALRCAASEAGPGGRPESARSADV